MQNEFLFFLAMMVFFFALWIAGGGPSKPISWSGPFITPVTDTGQSQIGYGDTSWVKGITVTGSLPGVRQEEVRGNLSSIENKLSDLQVEAKKQALFSTPSPLRGMVQITGGSFGTTDPDQEYITIQVSSSAKEPITLTGWRLVSIATDKGATIGSGARIPQAGAVNNSEPIRLSPGERAYVITGESPIGGSFAENMCTGYLESNQTFYPSLSRRCPSASGEFDRHFSGNPYKDNGCYTLIRETNSCTTPRESTRISAACIDLIYSRLTYNGCVASHRNDTQFSSGVWRVYLGRTEITRSNDSTSQYGELWKSSRDGIKLLDENGLTVDLYTY